MIRTQYLPLFARLGPYPPDLLDKIAYRDDEWFEAWCHEASLLPVPDEPLLRWHKERCRQGQTWAHLVKLAETDPTYIDEVLAQVRERPLTPAELTDPRPRDGEWWGDRSAGSMALDWLFRIGEVGIRRRSGFSKEFDLFERIIPASIREQPTPSEEDAHRELLRRAAASLGVAAYPELVDYHRLPKRPAKQRLRELIENGEIEEVSVEGWTRPAYLHPAAILPRSVDANTLLSPFDPVVWCRERTRRLFDFEYKIEIYTPAAQRRYGYYVLPYLLGDNIVARLDLRTDRTDGVLRVLGAFSEPETSQGVVVDGLRQALNELATFVGSKRWVVSADRGDLVAALKRVQPQNPACCY